MINWMNLSLIFMMMMMIFSKNPLKTSFIILLTSSIIFFNMKIYSGVTWMPLILFILFTGGILLMFMILSSIMPNEKIMKIKTPKNFFFLMAVMMLMGTSKISIKSMAEMKSFFSSSFNMIFMTSIILMYFFVSLGMNKIEDYSMRSTFCP